MADDGFFRAMRLGRKMRVRYAQDEDRQSWLMALLDAYALIDGGVAAVTEDRVRAGQGSTACREGCHFCCIQPIPVTPLEVEGVFWFLQRKASADIRRAMAARLGAYRPGPECPMLLDGRCAVHPLRPVICRDFNIFSEPCRKGEDPSRTRPGDLLTPMPRVVAEAYGLMLPYYGIVGREERREAVRGRYHLARTRLMQNVDWSPLATILAGAGRRASPPVRPASRTARPRSGGPAWARRC